MITAVRPPGSPLSRVPYSSSQVPVAGAHPGPGGQFERIGAGRDRTGAGGDRLHRSSTRSAAAVAGPRPARRSSAARPPRSTPARLLVEDDDARPVVGRSRRRARQAGATIERRRPAAIAGGQRGQRPHLGLGEPGLVGVAQEGRRAPVDAVDDERHAQLVAEAVRLVGPVPGRAGQVAVGVDAGRPGDPATVGEEGPLVDVLDDVLVVGQPRAGAADVAVDAAGEQDRPRVDRVPAVGVERDDGLSASATAAP